MNTRHVFAAVSVIALVIAVISVGYVKLSAQRLRVIYGESKLSYNPANLKEVAGFFSDIFVGRVIEKKDTQNEGTVSTQFSVEVFRTLKGEAEGIVTVRQLGGFYDGTWTIIEGDVGAVTKHADEQAIVEAYLLEPGKTYVFVTRYFESQDRYTLGSTSSSHQQLDIDAATSVSDVLKVLADNPNVKEMEDAIANQIVPARGERE